MKYIHIIFLSIFLYIGLVVMGYGSLTGLYHSYQAASWQETTGVVNSVRFSNKSGYKQASTSSRTINFEYHVNEKSYQGNKEYFGVKISTNIQSSGGYSNGHRVKVFYNPKMPEQSVLKPFERTAIWLGMFVSFIFTAFGLLILYKVVKKHN